jgi:voltage-dependent potassium channel beta subunit
MEYRFLGKTGLQVSALSLGGWVTYGGQVGEDAAYECMTAAFEHGVNFFDTAESYASGQAEIVMGKVIKRAGWKRSDLVISTKLFWGSGGDGPNDRGLSMKHIREGLAGSLERLQLDYVDLLFCHRPDFDTPIEETVRAMTYLIEQGKVFYWGTSEWSAEQIMAAWAVARREHLVPPSMEQPEYNMFARDKVEREFHRLYGEVGLGTTIFSPLDSGILTGKYNEGIPDDSRADLKQHSWLKERIESPEGQQMIEKVRRLTAEVAEPLGCSMAQLALAWCLKNPNVSSVITGASKGSQVEENMKALEVAEKLDSTALERIESILDNKPYVQGSYK